MNLHYHLRLGHWHRAKGQDHCVVLELSLPLREASLGLRWLAEG